MLTLLLFCALFTPSWGWGGGPPKMKVCNGKPIPIGVPCFPNNIPTRAPTPPPPTTATPTLRPRTLSPDAVPIRNLRVHPPYRAVGPMDIGNCHLQGAKFRAKAVNYNLVTKMCEIVISSQAHAVASTGFITIPSAGFVMTSADVAGYDFAAITSVRTPTDCGKICYYADDCQFWTWTARKCFLKQLSRGNRGVFGSAVGLKKTGVSLGLPIQTR
eukprot:m.103756 g.103756  ORF g.103756 m.103756 type:complete len:215 (+) comp22418_c0_seq3:34-678(+)